MISHESKILRALILRPALPNFTQPARDEATVTLVEIPGVVPGVGRHGD